MDVNCKDCTKQLIQIKSVVKEKNGKIVKVVVPRLPNRVIEKTAIVRSRENMKNHAEMKRPKKDEFAKKINVKKKKNQGVKDTLVSLIIGLQVKSYL